MERAVNTPPSSPFCLHPASSFVGHFFGLPGLRFVAERSTVVPTALTATPLSMTVFRGLPRLRGCDSVSDPESGCLRVIVIGNSTGGGGTFLGRPGFRGSPTDVDEETLVIFFGLPGPRDIVVDSIGSGVKGDFLGRPGPRREPVGKTGLGEGECFFGRPGPRVWTSPLGTCGSSTTVVFSPFLGLPRFFGTLEVGFSSTLLGLPGSLAGGLVLGELAIVDLGFLARLEIVSLGVNSPNSFVRRPLESKSEFESDSSSASSVALST